MKVIFFGTPEYVIPILEALKKAGYEIVAVVTQPPKPVGRKKILTPSPVAQWATKHNIRVLTDFSSLHSGEKIDVGVLAAYGRIISKDVIKLFPHGILNVHPSLLPQWRGASPIEATIISGALETGVTIIKLDEEVDHGPILAQFIETVSNEDTRQTLRKRLFLIGAKLVTAILPDYFLGIIVPENQQHKEGIYTTVIKKHNGFIQPYFIEKSLDEKTTLDLLDEKWKFDFMLSSDKTPYSIGVSPELIDRFVRAMNPWPGAWTKINLRKHEERNLKILKTHIEVDPKTNIPLSGLILDQVQLEGKNPVSWKQFKEGYPESSFQNSVKV